MSSITDALSKIRPDLNKQTKFQRNPETKGMAPAPSVAHEPRSAGANAAGRKFSLPALDEATARLSADDLKLLPAEQASEAIRGWFGLAWLATTRSRVLASTLAAMCAGIGIGFFPGMGDVSGRSQSEAAAVAPSAGEAIASAADAEAAKVARQRTEAAAPAAAQMHIKVFEPAKPSPAAVAAAAPAAAVPMQTAAPVSQELATNKVVLTPIRATAAAADPGAAQSSLVVRAPGKNSDAAAPAMVASATLPAAPIMGQDEPLPPAPKAYPQVQEILYEAVPSHEVAAAKPAGSKLSDAKPATEAVAAAPTKKAAPSITLSGIFWDEKTPMAMINGEIVEVGASIGGAKVVEIHQETVIVQQDGMRRTLAL